MITTAVPGAPGTLAGPSRWAVETHGLTKRFGAKTAVNGVELLVPRGSAFGYLGPNGAGKTTLIRVLLGLTRADAGTMSLLGYPVPRHRDVALARVAPSSTNPGSTAISPAGRTCGFWRRHANRPRGTASGQRWGASARRTAPTTGSRHTPWACASAWGSPPACWETPSCSFWLSSHLLDEVERTCDAVAIVDRGRIIQQGPISELLAGARLTLDVECSEPRRARALLAGTTLGTRIEAVPSALGLEITLPAGTGRHVIAEINRVLVGGKISVYRLQPVQTSLESWFLQVTSRLGDPE
jgi:ABC-2 type transport system ATP-binding protein